MAKYTKHFTNSKTNVPVSEKISDDQVLNNAGGFVYSTGPEKQFMRFLILGAEGPTYYASEKKLVLDNANNAVKFINTNGRKAVDLIVDVSNAGRAPKNDPAIFALALAASADDKETRKYALANLGKVCRIPTHLMMFANFIKEGELRGWGRLLRDAIGNWYNNQPIDKLAHQLVKYQSREGWANADLLRKARPTPPNDNYSLLYKWAVDDISELGENANNLPEIVRAFERAKTADEKETIKLIREYGLTREMVMTNHLKSPAVWEALLENMPITALIRNIATMTSIGLLTPSSKAGTKAADMIENREALIRGRVHPLTVLNALYTYKSGHGLRGSNSWTPVSKITDALDSAFYLAFDTVEKTGKNIMFALDVSASMTWANIAGTAITPRVASAALAMVNYKVEKNSFIVGFSTSLKEIDLSRKATLDSVIKTIEAIPAGGTDASLPPKYALKNNLDVDMFVTITDNETWAGTHPSEAINNYRKKMNKSSKNVIVGMTATQFTIADPKDPNTLDIVGFDTATPQLLSSFVMDKF